MKDVTETGLQIPTYEDMLAAHERIKPYIHRTPVLTSAYFNDLVGAELFFKCENFQKAGAFKVRGACNAVFGLPDDMLEKAWRRIVPATTPCRLATRPAAGASRATS